MPSLLPSGAHTAHKRPRGELHSREIELACVSRTTNPVPRPNGGENMLSAYKTHKKVMSCFEILNCIRYNSLVASDADVKVKCVWGSR